MVRPGLTLRVSIVWCGVFEVLRVGGFADCVGAVEPPAEVDKFAPLTAEGTVGGVLVLFHLGDFAAGWAIVRSHGYLG